MATARVDMKGFYKQKKKGNTGISKPSPKGLNKKKTPSPSFVSDIAQSPALVTRNGSFDLQDDYDQNEEVLRQFDMNMMYGPSIGMTRLDRWNRASKLGLNPPKEVENLLTSDKVRPESLWDSRV
ncbi:uncharacterized protein LOC110701015 [Chenopodium quinoa]|uniref:DNA polymerase delta subunit 4 n=1 Tax=Chenopodium quinoa TaxID=63459 RepID=A0A803L3Z4_CHEQI|nr:uncharacterized protein LOC110701015 [Chenopodium quinoa]